MMMCDLPHEEKVELEIWKRGWKFDQYLLGQLNYVAETYNKKFRATIETKNYADKIKHLAGRNVNVVSKKIDAVLIKSILNSNKPVIVYLDDFALHKYTHVPHYILATKIKDKSVTIAEPYEGKLMDVSAKTIGKGIIQLRNHIWVSPVIIELL